MAQSVVCDLYGSIEEIIAHAFSEGVRIEIDDDEDDEDVIWISSIERFGKRKGAGADVLQNLIEFASDNDLIIKGQIDSPTGGLALFYAEQGFEIESHYRRTIITRNP